MVLVECLPHLISGTHPVVGGHIEEMHIRSVHLHPEHDLVAYHLACRKGCVITGLRQTVGKQEHMRRMLRSELEKKLLLRGHIRLDEAVIDLRILYCFLVFVLLLLLSGICHLFHLALLAGLLLRTLPDRSSISHERGHAYQRTCSNKNPSYLHNYLLLKYFVTHRFNLEEPFVPCIHPAHGHPVRIVFNHELIYDTASLLRIIISRHHKSIL